MSLISRRHAAEFLRQHYGVGSYSWLSRLHSEGRGPRTFRFNAKSVLYDENDLREWADATIRPVAAAPAPVSPILDDAITLTAELPAGEVMPAADDAVARAFAVMRDLRL